MTRPRVLAALGVVVAAVLVGAALFGLWHVVVAGMIRGNVRAAQFGVALTAVSGLLLVGLVLLGRRVRAGPVSD